MNINIKAKNKNTFDAIVVGSGITGGWAAKELTEKSLKTLVLERGRNVEHVKDYPTANLAPWELSHGNKPTEQDRKEYYIQSKLYRFGQDFKHFLVKDTEHPYNQVRPFHWFRGYQVGGRSLLWARNTYRWSDLDFEANAKDGFGIDWPIRYKDIGPWYDYVEKFIGVSGENAGLPQLPDGILQPPFEMNCFEKHMRDRINKKYKDRHLISSRCAVLSQPHKGRGKCMARNLCSRGCPFGAYFSSNSSTLPAAAATGNLTLRPFSIVHSIIFDEQKNKAVGVRIIDAETKEMTEYFAKVIFLNASTLNSTLILLNSTSRRFPNGFGNSSDVLGHYLMDHHAVVGALGEYSGLQDTYYFGRRSTSVYVPRFQNVKEKHPDFIRGYGCDAYTKRESWNKGTFRRGFGAEFKDEITKPGVWYVLIEGYGECLPYFDNTVKLNYNKIDRWGMPTLDIKVTFRENEMNMRKDIVKSAVEMLEASDLDWVRPLNNKPIPGEVIHEMGTARMGNDPKKSVLNKYNQCHEAPNVFVTDGACMNSSACQNPSLTYMAITARACDHAVKELNRMNL